MTSGTYSGITVFQDRSNTASAAMSGGSNISNSGTFYLPSQADAERHQRHKRHGLAVHR